MSLPASLLNQLSRGKLIPLVGAGVSMAVMRKDGKRLFPSWTDLLDQAANRLDDEKKLIEANFIRAFLALPDRDLLAIADRAKKGLGGNWNAFLTDSLRPSRDLVEDSSLELAEAVWRLGSKLVVTLNFDEVLQWACLDRGGPTHWDIEAPADQQRFVNGFLDRPTIWHLHGQIHNTSRVILTPDGYHALYPSDPSVEPEYKAALSTLRQAFSTHSFLFIGCSLEDRLLLDQIRIANETFEGGTGPHFVLLREGEQTPIAATGLPIEVIRYADFGRPLVSLLNLITEGKAATSSTETAKEPEKTQDSPGSAYSPSNAVFYVPYRAKGNRVVGRDGALKEVREKLTGARQTAIGHAAVFQGMGGLGKTQLAVEYAHTYRDSYPAGVIWISANQDLDTQLIKISDKAGWVAPASESKVKIDIARNRLQTIANALIVFDNVEDIESIDELLPQGDGAPHILVTSRHELPGFPPVKLDVLHPPADRELLFQEAGRVPQGGDEIAAAEIILQRFGGLPLALELAGALLNHRSGMTWQRYQSMLDSALDRALDPRFLRGSFTKYESDIFKALTVDQETLETEPKLANILNVLAWSGAAHMGTDLLAYVLGVIDPASIISAIELGVSLRILRSNEEREAYSLHPLVRTVRRESYPLEGEQPWAIATAIRIGEWFETRREEWSNLPAFESEIDHLIAWAEKLSSTRLT